MARQTGMKVQVSNPQVALWHDEAYLRNKAEYEAALMEARGDDNELPSDNLPKEADPANISLESTAEPTAKKAKLTSNTNPIVYFDISIGGSKAGRIVFLLRADVVPSITFQEIGIHLLKKLPFRNRNCK